MRRMTVEGRSWIEVAMKARTSIVAAKRNQPELEAGGRCYSSVLGVRMQKETATEASVGSGSKTCWASEVEGKMTSDGEVRDWKEVQKAAGASLRTTGPRLETQMR